MMKMIYVCVFTCCINYLKNETYLTTHDEKFRAFMIFSEPLSSSPLPLTILSRRYHQKKLFVYETAAPF